MTSKANKNKIFDNQLHILKIRGADQYIVIAGRDRAQFILESDAQRFARGFGHERDFIPVREVFL